MKRTLGKGAYSKVKLGIDTETGEHVAVKIHKTNNPEFTRDVKEIVMTEVKTILKLEAHPNIISIKNFIDEAVVEKKNGQSYHVSCVVV